MPAFVVKGTRRDDLKLVAKEMTALGKDAEAALKGALNEVGTILADEAKRLAPNRTGRMAKSIKASKAKNAVTVTGGSNTTVKYLRNFHEGAIQNRPMAYTYTLKSGARVVRRLPDNPFMFLALELKQRELDRATTDALDKVLKEFGRG